MVRPSISCARTSTSRTWRKTCSCLASPLSTTATESFSEGAFFPFNFVFGAVEGTAAVTDEVAEEDKKEVVAGRRESTAAGKTPSSTCVALQLPLRLREAAAATVAAEGNAYSRRHNSLFACAVAAHDSSITGLRCCSRTKPKR